MQIRKDPIDVSMGSQSKNQQAENLQAPLSYREEDDMTLISLTEYARMHDKEETTLRKAARDGKFETAVKIAGRWLIDSEEPWVDLRTRAHRSEHYPH